MANTLGGWDATIIAQEGFEAFKQGLMPIMGFSTDFSSEAVPKGHAVTTRVISGRSAASFSNDYEADVGDTTTAKTVTLDQHYICNLYQSDREVQKSPASEATLVLQARECAYAVAKQIVDSVLDKVTASTFGDVAGTSKIVKATASVDADTIADMVGAANSRNIPMMNRSLIVSNGVMTALLKDNAIQAAYAFGNPGAIQDAALPRLMGCTVRYYNSLPSTIAAENTTAILIHPSAFAVALRTVPPPSDTRQLDGYEVVSDAETGIALGYRQWYNPKTGLRWGAFEANWGSVAAQTAGAVRLVSA